MTDHTDPNELGEFDPIPRPDEAIAPDAIIGEHFVYVKLPRPGATDIARVNRSAQFHAQQVTFAAISQRANLTVDLIHWYQPAEGDDRPAVAIGVRSPKGHMVGTYIELTIEQLASVVEQAAEMLELTVHEVYDGFGRPVDREPLHLNRSVADKRALALGPVHNVFKRTVAP